jgi:hypothetical protein
VGWGCGGRSSGGAKRNCRAVDPVSDIVSARRRRQSPVEPCGEDGLLRTAKACGSGTRCWCQVGGGFVGPTGPGKTVNSPTTVTRRIRRRGERAISRKAIAQGMPDASASPVCSCARFFVQFAHETAGAACTRHSLLPLKGRMFVQASGKSCREKVKSCLQSEHRHCEERSDEAIHFFVLAALWIASLRSQ